MPETLEKPNTKPKKTRRGEPIKNKLKKFKVWFQNVRGIKSKLESLRDKIDEVRPTVIGITETHLLGDEKVEIDGYEIYPNGRDNSGGGVLIAVRKELEKICTVVEKSKEVAESLWLTIDNGRVKIRVGVVYAPQESRTTTEDFKRMYDQISEQVKQAKERQQKVLLMGDLNCKVGDEIGGNKREITKSGRLLLKMIKKEKLTILNALDICEGLWTRTEGESRSVLDYIITDNDSVGAVKSMVIDEKKEFSPVGYLDNKISYSDYNLLIAKMD